MNPREYLLTVGRIIPDRDLDTLLRAFAVLRERHTHLRLVIVGSETPRTEYSAALERAAGKRVIFTGDVFGEALDALYAHCLLYVLASRVEGLPITVCEAMAHGRPSVLSDIPENSEVGGDAARYFKCGDDTMLAATLHDLIEDDEGRGALGAVGRKRVDDSYNWETITDQVESLYYRVRSGT